MSVGLKVIASIVGVTGLAGGAVAIALNKTGSSSVNSSEIVTTNSDSGITSSERGDSREIQTEAIQSNKEKNCKSIDPKDESVFKGLKIQKEDYTVIACKNANAEDSKKQIKGEWTGLFPNELFRNYWGLDDEEAFVLKTYTDGKEEDDFITTFKSDQLRGSSVFGDWGNTSEDVSGKSVTTINIVSEDQRQNNKIYLLFEQTIE